MSYVSKNLSVLAYANGFTLWHYTTPDALETVLEENYFKAAADMLRVGDMILSNTSTSDVLKIAIIFVSEVKQSFKNNDNDNTFVKVSEAA